jgi:hypothetical protein
MKKLEKFVNKNKCELQCTANQNKAIIFNNLQDVLTYSIVPSTGVTDYFYMQPFTGEISATLSRKENLEIDIRHIYD